MEDALREAGEEINLDVAQVCSNCYRFGFHPAVRHVVRSGVWTNVELRFFSLSRSLEAAAGPARLSQQKLFI